jgi:hypothetical protein
MIRSSSGSTESWQEIPFLHVSERRPSLRALAADLDFEELILLERKKGMRRILFG